jgi:hypothetical protein
LREGGLTRRGGPPAKVMDSLIQIITIAFYMIIPLGVLFLLVNIIYRKIRGKSIHSTGTIFVGEYIFKEWEPAGKRAAVEEIQYQREDKRDDAESGEPGDKGEIKGNW